MLVCLMVCVSVVGPALADDPKPQKPQHIPSVMRALHMKGRQVYRSLDQLLISGRSTVNEREVFAEFYESLQLAKPPQGSVESWRYDIERILGIVKEMDEAKDEKGMLEAGTKLLYATNCAACHEKYRYAPKPAANEVRPKSLDAGLKAIAAGGKHWSAPAKLDLGETKYMQPGRRLIVWPAEDVVHEARRGDRETAVFAVKFSGRCCPARNPPTPACSGTTTTTSATRTPRRTTTPSPISRPAKESSPSRSPCRWVAAARVSTNSRSCRRSTERSGFRPRTS